MNRIPIGQNDRVLSNLAIFVALPTGYRLGTDRAPWLFLCGQLQLRTGILISAVLVGVRESGLRVLTAGARGYLPPAKLHIATSENAAST